MNDNIIKIIKIVGDRIEYNLCTIKKEVRIQHYNSPDNYSRFDNQVNPVVLIIFDYNRDELTVYAHIKDKDPYYDKDIHCKRYYLSAYDVYAN